MPGHRSPAPRPEAATRQARGEEGAAAVELAIVLPLLLLLIFGLIDFGRVIQQQTQLTAAVREGARVGALNGTVTDMQTQVAGVLGTGVTVTYSNTSVCTSSSGSTADATITAKRAFVPITPLSAVMQFFGTAPATITLSATGQMACLG